MKYIILLVSLFFIGCSFKNEVNNYKIITINEKQGILKDNKLTVKPVFDDINSVTNSDINLNHPNYINLHWLNTKYAKKYSIVTFNGKKGIIDENGNFLLKPYYDNIFNFYHGFAKIEQDKKFGFIDENFNIILKPMFQSLTEFNFSDVAYFRYANKYGCLDNKMDMIIKPELDFIYPFFNELARFEKDGKWGFIDKNCKIVIKPTFNYAYDFDEDSAKVLINNNEAFIDKNGKLILGF